MKAVRERTPMPITRAQAAGLMRQAFALDHNNHTRTRVCAFKPLRFWTSHSMMVLRICLDRSLFGAAPSRLTSHKLALQSFTAFYPDPKFSLAAVRSTPKFVQPESLELRVKVESLLTAVPRKTVKFMRRLATLSL